MIRIMTADEPSLTTITVDGELAGHNIQAVETSCDQARSNGKPIWLHLRDVSVIGEAGQALLRRLATKGVCLKASGIYTSYIVQSIQPDLFGDN
jgi:anti-anti-sigma regulatory factor